MFSRRNLLFRSLCWLLVVIIPLSPSGYALAQEDSQPGLSAQGPAAGNNEQTRFILPYSAAIVSARPRQMMTNEATQLLPVEVVQAACLKELGFDPLLVEQVLFSAVPPLAGAPSYVILVRLAERIDLSTLSQRLIGHTAPGNRDGQPYLRSQDPNLPSLLWVGDATLLIAPEHLLSQLLSTSSSEPDDFAKEYLVCQGDDVAVLVNLHGLRPLIQMGLNQATAQIPPEFHEYLELAELLRLVRLRISVSGAGPLELAVSANNEPAAERVEELLESLGAMLRDRATQQAEMMLSSDDPVEQAMGRYIHRISTLLSEQLMPPREGDRFTLCKIDPEGGAESQLQMIAVSGFLVGLLLPAVQAAREAARRNTSMNNMKRILLALLNYEATKGVFPAYANFDDDGKPLLSWRVHVLPFMEEHQHLYNQFRLDEPWDSEHNRRLIPLMPLVYADPSSPLPPTEGRSHYLGVKGKGLAFDGSKEGRKFAGIRDGSSNSILVVQCNDSATVPWTKPQDWETNGATPLMGLANGPHPAVFIAGFFDGHVETIANNIDAGLFKKMLTVAGGEVIPFDR